MSDPAHDPAATPQVPPGPPQGTGPAERPGARDEVFDPPGIVYTRVSASLIPLRLISVGLWLGIPLLAAIVLAIVLHPAIWIAAGVLALLTLWLVLLIPRQVRAIGYAEAEDDLVVRKGILFRSLTVVPYGRMQFVDVNAGPLDRVFGVAKVQLHTASASTDATLPGLPAAEASRLRDRLTERGEANLAGL